jgi:hypothetical protein
MQRAQLLLQLGFKNAADFLKIVKIQRDRPGPNLKIVTF